MKGSRGPGVQDSSEMLKNYKELVLDGHESGKDCNAGVIYSATAVASRAIATLLFNSVKSKDLIT